MTSTNHNNNTTNSSSSSSSSSNIDPHQYVTNPPSTFVKLCNITKKPELNGKYGLIVQYDSTPQRYMVVLCTQQQQQSYLALKFENIQKCISFYDKSISQYQMILYNPQLQLQMDTVHQYILQQIVQPFFRRCYIPLTPQIQYFYYFMSVILLILWYFIGLTKFLIVSTVLFVVLSLIGSDLIQQKANLHTLVLHTLPNQYTKMIQNELSYCNIGTVITKQPLYLRSFTTLLIVFFLYTLFGTPTQSMYLDKYNWNTKNAISTTTVATQKPPQKIGYLRGWQGR